MKVTRNFDEIYRTEADPWGIGRADSERYNLYYNLIKAHARTHGTILDIGCGMAAFLSRLENDFQELFGIEVSREAIEKGQERHPRINFIQGSADRLDQTDANERLFDAIIYSDVISYLDERGKRGSLKWIAEHLAKDGLAFIAAWSPGGKYLEFDEFKRLVQKYFVIEAEYFLESEHAVFLTRRKRHLISITIDYETWHPIPEGKTIDWERDVFQPTEQLLRISDDEQVRLTLMAELGEYFWLKDNQPNVATRMEQQWIDAVTRGHDVQMHLHTNWLPELGARHTDGEWFWDWSLARIHNYPGDIVELIARCKAALENVLRPVDPAYSVTCYRAGAYATQPFKPLHDALVANEIFCDTSVYAGGVSGERGYDYSLAYSRHQPYFANPYDPQLKAPPSEQSLVELPVFTFEWNQRWFLDGDEGKRFAARLINFVNQTENALASESYRRRKRLRWAINAAHGRLKPLHRGLNPLLPKRLAQFMTRYEPEILAGHEYFVMIGHSKADLNFDGIAENLRRLKSDGRFEFLTLSEMVRTAREELQASARQSAVEEAEYQVEREYNVVLGDEHNDAQSHHLQAMIPLDRTQVLDFGCGAGHWSARIAEIYPWMRVTGFDRGADFIAKAQRQFASPRVSFLAGDFATLPFSDGAFECVYADNVLEHSFDVDKTLLEINRVLKKGGVLVAAIPSDARNPERICDNHTWKTAPHEVLMRLMRAGFVNVSIEEVDTRRRFGLPPYPPSNDQMMYLRAWKRAELASDVERLLEIMDWVYHHLNPEQNQSSNDPLEIIAGGFAWCAGYTKVFQYLLERENYRTRRVTFFMKPHPRGRGVEQIDTHSMIEVEIEGRWHLADPTCNVYFNGHSLADLVADPELAVPVMAEHEQDERFRERGYELYCTKWAFERCFKVDYENRSATGRARQALSKIKSSL
jgi:SAM-dependent methyltransferase